MERNIAADIEQIFDELTLENRIKFVTRIVLMKLRRNKGLVILVVAGLGAALMFGVTKDPWAASAGFLVGLLLGLAIGNL